MYAAKRMFMLGARNVGLRPKPVGRKLLHNRRPSARERSYVLRRCSSGLARHLQSRPVLCVASHHVLARGTRVAPPLRGTFV